MTRPMIWRGRGAAAHVAILGSFHLMDGALPVWVVNSLEEVDRVVFEADTSKAIPLPQLPNELTISGAWPSLAAALLHAAEATDTDLGAIDRLWPAAVTVVLSQRAMPHMRAELGVEAVLRCRSDELSIPRYYLESCAELYHFTILSPDMREQVAFLASTIQQLPDLTIKINRASAEWNRGNLEGVVGALDHARVAADFPTVAAGMFQNRHQLWAPRLIQYVEDAAEAGHRLLVVVGSGHLARAGNLFTYLEPHGLLFEQATHWDENWV